MSRHCRGALAALVVLLAPAASRAQTASWDYDQDLRLTYEYDDNVNEALREPVRAQLARIAYRGDMRWGTVANSGCPSRTRAASSDTSV